MKRAGEDDIESSSKRTKEPCCSTTEIARRAAKAAYERERLAKLRTKETEEATKERKLKKAIADRERRARRSKDQILLQQQEQSEKKQKNACQ